MSGPSGGAGLFLSSISLACGTCHSPPVSNLPIWRGEPSTPTAPTLTASCPKEDAAFPRLSPRYSLSMHLLARLHVSHRKPVRRRAEDPLPVWSEADAVHATLRMSVEGKKARENPLRHFRPGEEGRSEDVRSRRCAARQEACVGRRAPARRPSHLCTRHSFPMIHCLDRCRYARASKCIARSVGSVHAASRPATSW